MFRKYILPFIITLLVGVVTYILDSGKFLPAPLGKLLSAQDGIWQNAESNSEQFNETITIDKNITKGLTGGSVYLDDKLIPHVFGKTANDAYYMQGYLHAKFRLWQMEFQVMAAEGRLSEIFGTGANDEVLNYDKSMRRLGMRYGAEKSLLEIENDNNTKAMCDNYTVGVNAYINTLNRKNMPLEYKFLGYKPEKWSNIKVALFMKNMAFTLCGYETDFENTTIQQNLKSNLYQKLYPNYPDSLDPIVPKGTIFESPKVKVLAPTIKDSILYASIEHIDDDVKPNPANGSNNWAVSGKKTKSGAPILCNDPHLNLSIPSIWYEMQLSSPDFNAYGASFPGSPGIVIGYNDSCAFGFTNAMRDVRDYYEVNFKDASKKEFLFNNKYEKSILRVEEYTTKNMGVVYDTVAYVHEMPVMYDASFKKDKILKNNSGYAVKWVPNLGGNEIKMFYDLNRAKNYNDYLNAIKHLKSPGQNCIFASKNGDIAIWQQGAFPAYWKQQSDFIMPYKDSTNNWQGMIPQDENPHQINPERGFVSSANQQPTDNTYPYFYDASFANSRGIIINKKLTEMQNITALDMQKLQFNNEDIVAKTALPLLIENMPKQNINAASQKYIDITNTWNYSGNEKSIAPAIYETWWRQLKLKMFEDENIEMKNQLIKKGYYDYTLINLLKTKDSSFADNKLTNEKENISSLVTASLNETVKILDSVSKKESLEWGSFRKTYLSHIIAQPAFKPLSTNLLNLSGGRNAINCISPDKSGNGTHGPSWRMVVELTPETNAYGIYPGGQSGNPGSKYYLNFVDKWANGEYYALWMMKPTETKDKRIKWVMNFN